LDRLERINSPNNFSFFENVLPSSLFFQVRYRFDKSWSPIKITAFKMIMGSQTKMNGSLATSYETVFKSSQNEETIP
jgi:hypothetical protein